MKPLAQLSNAATGTTASPMPSPAVKVLTAKIGQELTSSNLAFSVTGAELKDTIAPPIGNPINARGKFLIVHMSVTSKLKENWTLSPDDIWTVQDDKKRQYKFYSALVGLPDSLRYRELAPSIPETGTLLYEVPADAQNLSLVVLGSETMVIIPLQPTTTNN
jgi:hypothetical protein